MFSAWTGNAIWLIRADVTSTGRFLSPEKGLSTMETNWREEKKLNDRRFRNIKSNITQAATRGKHKIQAASFVKYCTPREESDYWYAYYRITEKEKLHCSVEQNTTAGL